MQKLKLPIFFSLLAAACLLHSEPVLEEGFFKVAISGEEAEFGDLLIDGETVKIIASADAKIIKGGILAKLTERRFAGFISRDEMPTITGTLIADNTIDAIISSPKGSAKVCRITREGGLSDAVRREISKENMEQIKVALKKYSRLTNFDYPKTSGASAFEELRKKGHLKDTKVLVCPGTKTEPANEEETITERNIDYIYAPVPENFTMDAVPIAWDKPGNFRIGGHILFSNGDIIWLDGDNWQEKIRTLRNPPPKK
jgi:hypothetical protein